jgi:hypothetical protein
MGPNGLTERDAGRCTHSTTTAHFSIRQIEIAMNQLSALHPLYLSKPFGYKRVCTQFALALSAVALFSACGGVSKLTEQRVERSETVVRQARLAVGTSEIGAVELQRATEHLAAAKTALSNKREDQAGRFAHQAQLEAELAVARAETGHARRAANEVSEGTATLRQEIQRTETLR